MTSPRILVLTHRFDRFERDRYVLSLHAAYWRAAGCSVEVRAGPFGPADADLVIVHVDRTVVPPEYAAFARRFPAAVNLGATDLSKRRVSRQLATEGDPYDGPVIVKSDRNCGGRPELRHLSRSGPLGRLAKSVLVRRSWQRTGFLDPEGYPIYPCAAKVPRAVWRNPRLVVEKFLVERSPDGLYVGRSWMFAGPVDTVRVLASNSPIVKAASVVRREIADEVPDELRERRRELGLDFGKFDYAMVDGRPVLYDASRTPTYGAASPPADVEARNRALSAAIHAWLP